MHPSESQRAPAGLYLDPPCPAVMEATAGYRGCRQPLAGPQHREGAKRQQLKEGIKMLVYNDDIFMLTLALGTVDTHTHTHSPHSAPGSVRCCRG